MMNFNGRLLPIEVMDTILLLWIMGIAAIVGVVLGMEWRRGHFLKRKKGGPPKQYQKRRSRGKR